MACARASGCVPRMSGRFRAGLRYNLEHLEAYFATFDGRPVDDLADGQTQQRADGRSEHRDAVLRMAAVTRPHQGHFAFAPGGQLADAEAAVYGDHVGRHVARFADFGPVEFLAQSFQVGAVARGRGGEQALQTVEVVRGNDDFGLHVRTSVYRDKKRKWPNRASARLSHSRAG